MPLRHQHDAFPFGQLGSKEAYASTFGTSKTKELVPVVLHVPVRTCELSRLWLRSGGCSGSPPLVEMSKTSKLIQTTRL
jgi:hypothetical protein